MLSLYHRLYQTALIFIIIRATEDRGVNIRDGGDIAVSKETIRMRAYCTKN
jgi:hypothetical protein